MGLRQRGPVCGRGVVRHRYLERLADVRQQARRFAARTRIAQPRPKHRLNFDIEHQQLLFELIGARHYITVGREHRACAVEHQLILPAHQVDIRHEQPVIGGARGEHLFAKGALAGVKRRTVDVDDNLRPGGALHHRGPYGVPNVFADVHAHRGAVDGVHRALSARLEVARLVEDAVVGQVHLAVAADMPAVVYQRGGVVYVRVGVDIAHHGGDAAAFGGDALEVCVVVADELRLEQQILWRIARQRELREGDKVGRKRARLPYPRDDALGVARKIAHRRVYLCHCQSELTHSASRRCCA